MHSRSKAKPNREAQVTVSFSDSVSLERDHVEWSPKGVRLLTKWPFALGTELEFAFDHRGERHCCHGVVVACHPLHRPAGFYETVLFFIEPPCVKAQKAACDCRLAPRAYEPAGDSTAAFRTRAARDGAA